MSETQSESGANLPQSAALIKVAALYAFAPLPDCAALKPELALFCCARDIRGTLILAPEGINGTVAGAPDAIAALLDWLANASPWDGRLSGMEIKTSTAGAMPFGRMKVKLKSEIVTFRAEAADPARRTGTHVEAADWNALIADPELILIDARNRYETRLGSFAGARDPAIARFPDLKAFLETNLDPSRHRKVAMYCTGGIRCEKASSYLLHLGFSQVFQLKGGILRYLETVPEAQSRWQGECFVFDERVAITHGLAQGKAELCRECGEPHFGAHHCADLVWVA